MERGAASGQTWTTDELRSVHSELVAAADNAIGMASSWVPSVPSANARADVLAALRVRRPDQTITNSLGGKPQRRRNWLSLAVLLAIALIVIVGAARWGWWDRAFRFASDVTGYAAYVERKEEAARRAAERKKAAERQEEAERRERLRIAAAKEESRHRIRERAHEEERRRRRRQAEAEEEEERERRRRQVEAEEEERRRNPTVVFRITNNHPNSVFVQFRSSNDDTRFWPAEERVYVIRDGAEHLYRLDCKTGEKICFGAWVEGSALNPYWGGGYRVGESCSNCCLTCPAWTGVSFRLDASDAIKPSPSMTWRLRSYYAFRVSAVFYSATRRGHEWPGGNREFVLRDSSIHTFKIGCRAGEKICYGAWPTNNPRAGYWGAGFRGNQGCTNCCRTCDGTMSDVINLR